MARCLIVGCGCRGLSLAGELVARGHAVRGTTRDLARAGAIEAVGAEPLVGDPDRFATLARAFDHVAVACLLLGSATGSPERVQALHGSRLEMLLTRMIDTTVRGVVYESAGSVDQELLAAGAARVRQACEAIADPVRAARCRSRRAVRVARGRGARGRARAVDALGEGRCGSAVGRRQQRADPVKQVGEDPRRRAPDELVRDHVRVGPDRDSAPH